MKTLVLGCGNKVQPGAVNHDLYYREGIDVVWDLNDLPWPWHSREFNRVVAESVLEHLYKNLLVSMDEIWRITAPGGIAVVKLPYWQAEESWNDPTHIHKVGMGVFDQLDPSTARGKQYDFYTTRKWKIEERRLNDEGTSVHFKLRKLLG